VVESVVRIVGFGDSHFLFVLIFLSFFHSSSGSASGGMKLVLVLLVLFASCERSDAFLWTLSNLVSLPKDPRRVIVLETDFSERNSVVGLVKFDFWKGGSLEADVTISASDFDKEFDVGKQGLFEVLICSSRDYREIFAAESAERGSFCALEDTDFICERFASSLMEETSSIFRILTGELVMDTRDTAFIVLSACELVAFEQGIHINAMIEADMHFESGQVRNFDGLEITLIKGLAIVLFWVLSASIASMIYISAWRSRCDMDLHKRLRNLLILKSACILGSIIVFWFKFEGDRPALTIAWYAYLLLLGAFFTSIVRLVLQLSLGLFIREESLSDLDRHRVSKFTLAFWTSSLLFTFWRENVFVWVFLFLLYVIVVSTSHQLVTFTLSSTSNQCKRVVAKLDSELPARARTCLERRHEYLEAAVLVVWYLRVFLILYLGVCPFLLLLLQIVLAKLAIMPFVLVITAELFDFWFIVALAIVYRVRDFANFVETSPEEQNNSPPLSQISSSAIFPIIRQDTEKEEHQEPAVQILHFPESIDFEIAVRKFYLNLT